MNMYLQVALLIHDYCLWKLQDYSAMMSGTQKGLPLKVPTIPIKVLTPNTAQVYLLIKVWKPFYVQDWACVHKGLLAMK